MGEYIGLVKKIRSTGRGSDLYGNCDQCGKHMSECFVYETRRMFKRHSGEVYSSPSNGGAYGHKDCLEKHFGKANIEDFTSVTAGTP